MPTDHSRAGRLVKPRLLRGSIAARGASRQAVPHAASTGAMPNASVAGAIAARPSGARPYENRKSIEVTRASLSGDTSRWVAVNQGTLNSSIPTPASRNAASGTTSGRSASRLNGTRQ